jgi:hypothetical protein
MTEQEQVQVTVEDIEAADLFDVHWYADFDRKQADELAKAFARHRHTATAEALEAMREARASMEDMLAGWRYIRHHHGDLYGVGWDRAETRVLEALPRLTAAIAKIEEQQP